MRSYIISNEKARCHVIAQLQALSLEPVQEVVIKPFKRKRSTDQNALYWAGPLKDISSQVVIEGRKYSAEAWHHHFKTELLPETEDADIQALVRNPDAYMKWEYTPNGERILKGSTGDLTKKGFSEYLEQIYAYGADMGVMFTTVVAL